jgi:O-antigen/teichoic acid export membrane protein
MKFNQYTKKIFRNAGVLISGNAISSVFELVSFSLITRALSLEDFGRYTLIIGFIFLIDRLINFQSWQALIHFGAKAKDTGDSEKLISLFSFGWIIDVATGIAGYLIVLMVSFFVPQWFGLGDYAIQYVAIAGFVILFNWTSVPTAFLRLYNKFYIQALYQKITAGSMLIFTSILWFFDQNSILPYLVVLAISDLIGKFFFFSMAFREIYRQKLMSLEKIKISKLIKTTPHLLKFLITTNLDGIVKVFRDIDIFIINGLLGSASVALYKIARTLTKTFAQLTGPFFQVIYPELSKLFAAKKMDDFTLLMKQTSKSLGLITFAAWFIFLIFGTVLLNFIFGHEYTEASEVTKLCMAGMVVWSIALPLSPAMMALGRVENLLVIHITTTIIYLLLLIFFLKSFGLLGAGIAFLLFYLIWSLTMFFTVKHHLKIDFNKTNVL